MTTTTRRRQRPTPARRAPGEPNPWVPCACGCGKRIRQYDAQGRRREYRRNHAPIPTPLEDAIFDALTLRGPLQRLDIVEAARPSSPESVGLCLLRLCRQGRVKRIAFGVYDLA